MIGIRTVARVARELRRDVSAAHERDPAARGVSALEILATWPGVHALLAHRVAHALNDAGVPVAPRAIAATARTVTGIEIHPAADVGDGLFIDHGMGVVVGETAEIGENVTLYQGVTLGGTGFATGKRHPTVEDNVTIGSGAKLLGPDPDRPRRQDRRQRGRRPRRAAELHRGRQPRPHRARRGPQARGARRRLGAPARPDRRRAEGALEADRRARARARRGPRRAGRAARRRAAAAPRAWAEPRRWVAPPACPFD